MQRLILFVVILSIAFMTADAQKQRTKTKKPAKPSPSALPLPEPYRDILANAKQLVVVTTPGWNSVNGTLSRFERNGGRWQSVGEKVPVVVGKSGLGWDGITESLAAKSDPVKKEGDGRSPAGIFKITGLFGFDPSHDFKMPYSPITDSTECVDDSSSQAYNQIVDRKQIPYPDWNSSEKMRSIAEYKLGAVVDYNSPKVPDAGSCIFLHIWKGPGHGTAGCTAMDENEFRKVIDWVDAAENPVIVQLPVSIYDRLRAAWQLP